MQFLKDIFYLFYPKLCVNCSITLLKNESFVCTICKNELPVIVDNQQVNKVLLSVFYGKVAVKNVRSFLYFNKKGITQKLIHQLKYKNQPEIGIFIGDWFGKQLKETTIFKDVDVIISVPLHPKKLKKRGYNQLTKFGETLSEILEIPYQPNILTRISTTNTQTLKQRLERFSNHQKTFKLTDFTIFENKHILLIDDVITTGATLHACAKELSQTKNITISIATMAYTQKD